MAEVPPGLLLRLGLEVARSSAQLLGPGRHLLADAIGSVVWLASPRRRRRAVLAHRRADPDLPAAGARWRAWACFREYARTTADFFWAHRMAADEVRRRTAVVGLEHLDGARRQGRGGVLAGAHLGNWDIGAAAAAARGIGVTTVMAPLGPAPISRLVAWARRESGIEVLPSERGAVGLVRAVRRGGYAALLCDIPAAGPTVVVRFRGGPVRFSSVPARLARRSGAVLLPVACLRAGDWYRVEVLPPVDLDGDDTVVMQRVADALERVARGAPCQWYPFGAVYADADART